MSMSQKRCETGNKKIVCNFDTSQKRLLWETKQYSDTKSYRVACCTLNFVAEMSANSLTFRNTLYETKALLAAPAILVSSTEAFKSKLGTGRWFW